MTPTAKVLFDFVVWFTREIAHVIYDNTPLRAYRIHPHAVTEISEMVLDMRDAAWADDARRVAELGAIIRQRTADEFIAAGNQIGTERSPIEMHPGRWVLVEKAA